MRRMMVWKLKRMRKQRKLYNCMLCGKIVKPSQNSTVIMSMTIIQNVDNVYSNCGLQMVEKVEVSKKENEDNIKLLKFMKGTFEDGGGVIQETFEDGGDEKREGKNLNGSRGGEQYIVVQYSTLQYSTVQAGVLQYSAVQYREAFEEAGEVKRVDGNIQGSRGGVLHGVHCGTVQYSTV